MIARSKAIQIRTLAREKLLEHDAMRLPIDPEEIAGKLNIVVQSFTPEKTDISGFLMQLDSSFGIGFSTAIKNKGFQKFTISHELGHYFLEGHPLALLKDGLHYSRSGFISKDSFEQEADIFASEFLMPWKLVEKVMNHNRSGFPAIQAVSESCESSLVASAIRYAELAKECVAVIVSHQNAIEFMVASDSFRQIPGIDWLRRKDDLPSNVPSCRLGATSSWVERCSISEESSDLSDWFSSAPSVQIEEHVVGLGSYKRLLTVLVADLDLEEQSEEESNEDDYIERWKAGRYRK